MGLIYTAKDFDCVAYLGNVAANKLKKKFGLSSNKALEVLAKSLLYTNYENLINDINSVEDEYESRNGCFFSEFVLANELEIEIHEAYSLKKELDNHHYYGSGVSHGNIEVANLTDVSTYSLSISLGDESRLMFSYPIDFYTRIYDQSFLLEGGEPYSIESLWCDGFSFLHPSYFSTGENKKLYVESIFESLLSHNHLVVSYRHYDYWIEHDPLTYSFFRNNFENYLIYDRSIENRPYGIYFPHKGKSLRKRLGFFGSLIDSTFLEQSTLVKDNSAEMGVSDILRRERLKKNLTQTQLASASKISIKTIGNIERGAVKGRVDTLKILAKTLQIDVSVLI